MDIQSKNNCWVITDMSAEPVDGGEEGEGGEHMTFFNILIAIGRSSQDNLEDPPPESNKFNYQHD